MIMRCSDPQGFRRLQGALMKGLGFKGFGV